MKNKWGKSWERVKKTSRDYVSAQWEESDIVATGTQGWMCWALSLVREGLSAEVTFEGKRWA